MSQPNKSDQIKVTNEGKDQIMPKLIAFNGDKATKEKEILRLINIHNLGSEIAFNTGLKPPTEVTVSALVELFTKSLEEADRQQLLAELEGDMSKIIGDNEPEFNTPKPDLPAMCRNRLREQQRTEVTALLNNKKGEL